MPENASSENASSENATSGDTNLNQQVAEDEFVGHRPEAGILTRLRDWTDVAPPLLLARTLRLAGSPIMVGCVWALWAVTGFFIRSVDSVAGLALGGILLGIVWMVVLMILVRQGALLVAGRDMEDYGKICRRILDRWLAIAVVLLAIPVGVFATGLIIIPPAWIARMASDFELWQWIQIVAAVIVAIAILPAAVLMAGGGVAVVMGLTALVNEPEPDPLDSLSRGYEYVMRGWLAAIGYAAVAGLVTLAIYPAAGAIAWSASWLITAAEIAIGRSPASQIAIDLVRELPTAMMAVVACGCTGGIYLFLRRWTGGKEIEDLWLDPRSPPHSLPELKVD